MDWGRSSGSVWQGVTRSADRWSRSSGYLRNEDQKYAEKLAKPAKMHSGESLFGCDDAPEAVVFSVLIGLMKRQENQGCLPEISGREYQGDGCIELKYWT